MISKGKRGQISTYMIMIAIVLIMIFAYFAVKRLFIYDVQPFPVVNPSFKDVHELVQSCLTINGKDAIKIAALQGGYIKFPQRILLNKDAHLNLDGTDQSILKIPYWYWRGYHMAPDISEIEEQISTYVEENIGKCIDNFNSLNSSYKIEFMKPIAITKLYDENVQITLKFPISAQKLDTGEKEEIDTFRAILDAKLKKLYDLGLKIHKEEAKTNYLENTAFDLLSINKNIPLNGLEVDCNRKEWNINNVKKELMDTLYVNLPRIRIEDTDYVPFSDDEEYAKKHLLWDFLNDNYYKDVRAVIEFSHAWNFGLNARPRDGDLMYAGKSRSLVDYLPNFCLQFYHFTYDVSFPVRITLSEDTSFDGEGLIFTFAEPVIINHNEPNREQFGVSDFFSPIYKEEFCNEKSKQEVRVRAYDRTTGFFLNEVNLSLSCISRYCPLGVTEFDNEEYSLYFNPPAGCSGAYIEASKPGYLIASKFIDFTEQSELDIGMIPVADIPFEVKRRTINGPNEGIERSIPLQYDAYVQVENGYASDFKRFDSENESKNMLNVILADNKYNLTIQLLNGDKLIGGYRGTWNYTYDEIVQAGKITFYVADYGKEIGLENITNLEQDLYYPKINLFGEN